MEIKKNSWHYKLWQKFGPEYSKERNVHTTCSYVEGVLVSIIAALSCMVMIIFMLIACCYLIVCGLVVVPYVLLTDVVLIKDTLLYESFNAGVCVLIATLLPIIFIVVGKMCNKLKKRHERKLLEQLVSDRKNKVCTVVTFK